MSKFRQQSKSPGVGSVYFDRVFGDDVFRAMIVSSVGKKATTPPPEPLKAIVEL